MKLKDLQDNQIVKYRLGRAGPDNVIWQDWEEGRLYVKRREHDLPTALIKRSRSPFAGDIVSLVIYDKVDCPDFGGDDFDPSFNVFNVEDYYLEIEGLET